MFFENTQFLEELIADQPDADPAVLFEHLEEMLASGESPSLIHNYFTDLTSRRSK